MVPQFPGTPLDSPHARGASRAHREREGAEAAADGGGLLAHYKITKNKWKTIKGFKSK
jgi:hypothetical protein